MVDLSKLAKMSLWVFVLGAPAVVALSIPFYVPVAGRERLDLDTWVITSVVVIALIAFLENRYRKSRSRREEASNV